MRTDRREETLPNIGDTQIFINVLMGILAGIITVAAAMKAVSHIMTVTTARQRRVNLKVEEHEHELDEHTKHLDNDHKRLNELESSNKLILRALMQIMSHELDGNHVEQMEKARDDIHSYLINKS